MIDRYGDPPRSVQGLVDISLVRVTAARAGIVEIVQRNDNLILYTDVVTPAQMGAMMDAMPHRVIYNAVGRPLHQPACPARRGPSHHPARCRCPAAGCVSVLREFLFLL